MKTQELKNQVRQSMALLIGAADELRDLDQVLGDGDLGITISAGAKAVIEALDDVADDSAPSDLTRACAKAFANANPSTMAALVAGGLLQGSKAWSGKDEITVADAELFIRSAADSISHRGKSQVGDKTILDAIVPAADALAASPQSPIDAAIEAAADAVIRTRDLQSKRGRASWLQDRSIGLQDPGATAFLRMLEAWRDAENGDTGPKAAVYDG
ncbi:MULTISPECIES: DAK2 domain-containing protein [unclassified Schaalia]|uniref:DAK2 domain-containing protein n=1 Tax=unclassified Schaalia TaxID=2691889 RepID=UPI001E562421|nr:MULTISPECIES: DAK2 domain-containing protein [unclassified Schaalia]